jgi:hypothetical protein
MKKVLAGAAVASLILGNTAFAGGMAEPMMEPEVIVEESSASSGGFVVPLILLALLVAVAGSDGTPAPR